jgi:hypothetical protein
MIAGIVDGVTQHMSAMLDGPNVEPIPPFMP